MAKFKEKIKRREFNNNLNFYEIAKDNGLSNEDAKKFVVFMDERFPNVKSKRYVVEWVNRIKKGYHYSFADDNTKHALQKAGF